MFEADRREHHRRQSAPHASIDLDQSFSGLKRRLRKCRLNYGTVWEWKRRQEPDRSFPTLLSRDRGSDSAFSTGMILSG